MLVMLGRKPACHLIWAMVVGLAVPPAAPGCSEPPDPAALLQSVPTAQSLGAWHELLASEPHVAGTPGDAREIERLRAGFAELGLSVEVHPFWALLPQPQSALVEVVGTEPRAGRRGVIALPLDEPNLAIDPATAHPDLKWGWNAYSASGDVTGEAVYANYGTAADFARLRELGVDCHGKVVIARYGGNFRGYKVKFAEEAGAAALVIYTDPADAGSGKGKVWPDGGGWASDRCIQRGSLLTLDYPGDPLTPGIAATEFAERLPLESVRLPTIPVQPVGYAAAGEILSRMAGKEVADESWRGGLTLPYRLEGGPALKVRVAVAQDRQIRQSANVIARIKGTAPDGQRGMVIVGCHHDAWCFGAADPLAGTIVLMECARSFAELSRAGWQPTHDILFAAWGAEEYFLIGSTEWVEANEAELLDRCHAYINLDMAAMGESFGPAATPSLREAVIAAAKLAKSPPAVDGGPDRSVFEAWTEGEKAPKIGDMGGGSDHAAFICRVGVPSIGLGSHGSQGTSYHSNYDTVAWYRATVGSHYRGALMLSRVCNQLLLALSQSAEVPINPAGDLSVALGLVRDLAASDAGKPFADLLQPLTEELEDALVASANQTLTWRQSITAERAWLDPRGIPGRSWNRNLFISNDPVAGYGSQSLPALRDAIGSGKRDQIEMAVGALVASVRKVR